MEDNDIEERVVTVIRNGKRVRKVLVKRLRRKKRRTPKQKAGARVAARKRKSKSASINRKRAKSVKKRTGLKRNTNKRFRVREDMKLVEKLMYLIEATINVQDDDGAIEKVTGVNISNGKKGWKIATKGDEIYVSKDGKVYDEVEDDHPALDEFFICEAEKQASAVKVAFN